MRTFFTFFILLFAPLLSYSADQIPFSKSNKPIGSVDSNIQSKYGDITKQKELEAFANSSENLSHSWIVLLSEEAINSGIGQQLPSKSAASSPLPPAYLSQLIPVFDKSQFTSISNLSSIGTAAQNRLSRYVKVYNPDLLDFLLNSSFVEHYEENHIYHIEQESNIEIGEVPWYFPILSVQEAWKTSHGEGVSVAVIDTGIDWDHEELKGRILINELEDLNGNGSFDPWPSDSLIEGVTGDFNGIDDDGNGYADDVIGYDFVDLTSFDLGDSFGADPIPNDEHGHGTSMSSLIAANADGKRITGVAPFSKILTIRSFDTRGNGESDDIAKGIIYAVARGARIINMSFGDAFESFLVRDAVRYANASGALLISSAGNSGTYINAYPSDYAEVLSISGLSKSGGRYGRSNFGSMIDLAAPAVDLPASDIGNSYKLTTGTSGASALVSGIAALALSANPEMSPEELRSAIESATDDYGNQGWDSIYGNGVINATKAVNYTRDTRVAFLSPDYGTIISDDQTLNIKADIVTPLFLRWELSYALRYGVLDNEGAPEWKILSEGDKSGRNLALTSMNTNSLPAGLLTLRLKVEQTNNISIEKRIYITVYESQSLEVERDTVYHSFINGQPGLTIFEELSQPTQALALNIHDKIGLMQATLGASNKSPYHVYDIEYPDYREDYEFHSRHLTASDTVTNRKLFSNRYPSFSQSSFGVKDYTLPFSIIQGDIYTQNGKEYFAATEFANLVFGTTNIYNWENNEFISEWSTTRPWVIKSSGDMNGDGEPELLATLDAEARIFSHQGAQNPFENEVFKTNERDVLWGIGMTDIDGDGDMEAFIIGKVDEEIFGFNDVLKIIDFQGGQYVEKNLLPMAGIDTDRNGTYDQYINQNDLQNDASFVDLDGDGNIEIIISDYAGRICVYEITNNSSGELIPEYQRDTPFNSSNHYFTSGDFDGNGDTEVAILGWGQGLLTRGEDTPAHDNHNLRILRHRNGAYEVLPPYIYRKTRNNIGLQWGISSGDIHTQPGEELIINAFPYTYIMSLSADTLRPLYSAYGILSRGSIVHDFDGNGKNELLLNTFNETNSFEQTEDVISTPVISSLRLVDETAALLQWYPTKEGRYLVAYVEDGQIFPLQETNNNQAVISGLDLDQNYTFTVASVGNTGNGFFELPRSIKTSDATEILQAEKLNDKLYKVKFDGFLPEVVHYSSVIAESEPNTFHYPEYSYSDGDSILIMSFRDPIPKGSITIIANPFQDRRGLQSKRSSITIENPENVSDKEYFTLVSAELIGNGNLIQLHFSEAVTMSDRIDAASFSIEPYGSIFNPGPSFGDSTIIQINVSSVPKTYGKGFEYCIEVDNLVSDSGREIAEGFGNKACFAIPINDLNAIYAYPQPWKASNGQPIVFSELMDRSEVTIIDVSGNIIATLVERDNNGGVSWDGIMDNGELIGPGVYFFSVSAPDGNGGTRESLLKKFAVIQ